MDPNYRSNRHIYVFWTSRAGTTCPRKGRPWPENRVSRFTLDTTATAVPGSEFVVADRMPSFKDNHNAGALHFGADGMLYVSVGASGCQLENPLYEYSHAGGCEAITAGAFVPGTAWGSEHAGSYLFGDYVCGFIFERRQDGSVHTFASQLAGGAPIAMAFGPYNGGRALYYTGYTDGGQVRRIARSTANEAPVAAFSTKPRAGNLFAVDFDPGASYDPDDGEPASYRWDFGDGTTRVTTTPTTSRTYSGTATRTVRLRVVDPDGAVSAAASSTVAPGTAAPQIDLSGAPGTARYAVGQRIVMSVSASDAEDGTLPPEVIRWQIVLWPGTHTHSFAGPISGRDAAINFPEPEGLDAVANSRLEVIVTAKDSSGYVTTLRRLLRPSLVNVGLAAEPSGAKGVVQGRDFATPATVTSWANWLITLAAPDQVHNGTALTCTGWSNGGPCSQVPLRRPPRPSPRTSRPADGPAVGDTPAPFGAT